MQNEFKPGQKYRSLRPVELGGLTDKEGGVEFQLVRRYLGVVIETPMWEIQFTGSAEVGRCTEIYLCFDCERVE